LAEFINKELCRWLAVIGIKTAYIKHVSSEEKSFCKNFNCILRDIVVHGKIFYSPKEIKVSSKEWRSTIVMSGPIVH